MRGIDADKGNHGAKRRTTANTNAAISPSENFEADDRAAWRLSPVGPATIVVTEAAVSITGAGLDSVIVVTEGICSVDAADETESTGEVDGVTIEEDVGGAEEELAGGSLLLLPATAPLMTMDDANPLISP